MSLNNLSYIGENLRINENNLLTDLCGLQYLLINDGLIGTFVVSDNAYNPSQQDIIDGNCSL